MARRSVSKGGGIVRFDLCEWDEEQQAWYLCSWFKTEIINKTHIWFIEKYDTKGDYISKYYGITIRPTGKSSFNIISKSVVDCSKSGTYMGSKNKFEKQMEAVKVIQELYEQYENPKSKLVGSIKIDGCKYDVSVAELLRYFDFKGTYNEAEVVLLLIDYIDIGDLVESMNLQDDDDFIDWYCNEYEIERKIDPDDYEPDLPDYD